MDNEDHGGDGGGDGDGGEDDGDVGLVGVGQVAERSAIPKRVGSVRGYGGGGWLCTK